MFFRYAAVGGKESLHDWNFLTGLTVALLGGISTLMKLRTRGASLDINYYLSNIKCNKAVGPLHSLDPSVNPKLSSGRGMLSRPIILRWR